MDNKVLLSRLRSQNVRPTAIRLLVYRSLCESSSALSITDIEDNLETVDKSTISRTLNLFHAHHLVHSIDGASGVMYYAPCKENCSCTVEEDHAHFRCERCGRIYCMEDIPAPATDLPEGYSLNNVSYVLQGICPECRKK